MNSTNAKATAVRAGDRRQLARAITLIESTRPEHRQQAESLISALLPFSGNSIRIGISGVPGVGKSTFIEAFGLHLIKRGHRVCVLAVDPSSPLTGGSILGDKTRMEDLSRNPNAFIRPSPSSGTLGGVARRTRETILVCEAAGFDVVLVETVGVGQSEIAVADLVDLFLLLIVPGGGDELQGIKKGIVELADMIVVNKADGELRASAERAQRDYGAALHLLRATSETWQPTIHLCSSLSGSGIDEIWAGIEAFKRAKCQDNAFDKKRTTQATAWMWNEVHETLYEQLHGATEVSQLLPKVITATQNGTMTPSEAARKILTAFKNRS